MRPGSVIVDLAPSAVEIASRASPTSASSKAESRSWAPPTCPAKSPTTPAKCSRRILSPSLLNMVEDGQLKIDESDEIISGTLVAEDGQVKHPRIREMLGMEPLETGRRRRTNPKTQTPDSHPAPTNNARASHLRGQKTKARKESTNMLFPWNRPVRFKTLRCGRSPNDPHRPNLGLFQLRIMARHMHDPCAWLAHPVGLRKARSASHRTTPGRAARGCRRR